MGHQPARSLGNGEQQQDEDRRRRGHHAEHPAPSGLFGDDLADDEVAQVGEQDAEHDIELDEADQAAALGRRGDLSGVDRCTHARHADADTAEEPEEHEDVVTEGAFGCQGGPQRTDEVEGTDDEQHLAAAVLVGELPGEIAPTMVPMVAIATVKPRPLEVRLYTRSREVVVPEITAVSKPKIKPPMEATMALRMTSELAPALCWVTEVSDIMGLFLALGYGVSCGDICYNVVATRVTTL
ncbi:hypothetical protein SDC9_134659 [bioreactor metagenome]|uniref:Uncharacterized protein n=1 Tax=bioreactor metagenome TaxID=1076179 RepID=A0A645DE60_9ZZZZ